MSIHFLVKRCHGAVILAGLCGGAAVSFALAAWSGPSADAVPSALVKFDDLALSGPQGASVLYDRIHGAAVRVCPESDRGVGAKLRTRTCIRKAVADAVSKVNRPALTAVYQERNGVVPVQRLRLAAVARR